MLEVGPFRLRAMELPGTLGGFNANELPAVLCFGLLSLAMGAVVLAFVLYGIHLLRRVVAPMGEGRPFSREAPRNIRRLAFAMLALCVAEWAAAVLVPLAYMGVFGSQFLLGSGDAVSLEPTYSLDLVPLFGFFVLLLLSYVFEYGAKLQNLSDDTF